MVFQQSLWPPRSALSVRLGFSCPVPSGSLQQDCPWLFVVCNCLSSLISWSWCESRGNSFWSSMFSFPADRWLQVNPCLGPPIISALLRPSAETHQKISCPESSLFSCDFWLQRLSELSQIPSSACSSPLTSPDSMASSTRCSWSCLVRFFHQSLFFSKKML